MRKLALLFLFATACTSARQIRQAQDRFSAAATAENTRLAPSDIVGAELLARPDALTEYRSALSLVDNEIKANGMKLRQERLMGAALVLKAMCHWRIDFLEQRPRAEVESTLATIDREAAAGGIVLGERDAAMRAALPGLRDHDRGLAATTYADQKRFFRSAIDAVRGAIKGVPEGHPVGVYLRFAVLSSCRAWQSAAVTADAMDDVPVIVAEARTVFGELLAAGVDQNQSANRLAQQIWEALGQSGNWTSVSQTPNG